MRRSDREIDAEKAKELLIKGEYGVLSTVDENGQPYGVPLNYAYHNNCIYFHSALAGHKISNVNNNSNVSFCVVGDTKVLPVEFSTEYESAIVFGTASEIDGHERHSALMLLVEKYSPDFISEGEEYIKKMDEITKVVRIEIKNITGKKR